MTVSLINDIEKKMGKFLNQEQKDYLHKVLEEFLAVPDEEDKRDGDLVQLFIAAKRVEGCSGKTVKYYERIGWR